MKGIIIKEIKTKNGIIIIVAATLIILGGILLTNIDLIFGAGTGDADTLDSMDWAGDDCSGVDCNIKDYIDAKSAPCADDNTGQCYIAEATKSTLDTDLAAGNIKKDVNIFGTTGDAKIKCAAQCSEGVITEYCTVHTDCSKWIVQPWGYGSQCAVQTYADNDKVNIICRDQGGGLCGGGLYTAAVCSLQ